MEGVLGDQNCVEVVKEYQLGRKTGTGKGEKER